MFFPEKIISIKKTDKVLEVGPGATPYSRSDTFLELNYDDENERIAQSGYVGILKSDKQIIYYDGKKFPFEDNEFDYVVCSHVLEHVENVSFFINEISRVAKKGYIEFPTALYDYLYDFKEHTNFCYYHENKIYWAKKTDFNLNEFKPLTNIFYNTLVNEHFSFINSFKNLFFQGFEWENSLETIKTNNLKDLIFENDTSNIIIQESSIKINTVTKTTLKNKLKLMLKLLFKKFS